MQFIDPRTRPTHTATERRPRTTSNPKSLTELHRLCRQACLYEVERWIQDGHPVQVDEEAIPKGHYRSALEIALEADNYALVLLLLCNGYDPNLERYSPLDLALQSRRWDLVELLLGWGANPHHVDLEDLYGTYNSKMFERFRALGVDMTEGRMLAETLAYHTSNKPAFGYAKRHKKDDSRVQDHLNSALAYHVKRGNEKGIELCLWAGADPHAQARSLSYGDWTDDTEDVADPEERFIGFSAIHEAARRGNTAILKRLGPDPAQDDWEELYRTADSRSVMEFLAEHELPQDVGTVVSAHVMHLSWGFGGEWKHTEALRSLFEIGARWQEGSKDQIAGIRRNLLKLSDHTFVDTIKLLATKDYCAPEVLKELGRTPAFRRKMKEVGFIPSEGGGHRRRRRERPTRSREVLTRFGIALPKPEKPKQQSPKRLHVGSTRRGRRELRLTREELFEKVWAEPVSKLAEKWGLSGPGLAKACRRAKVPVPGRGYWAKVHAGKRVRRPRLPEIPEGELEQIGIWVAD